MGEMFREIATIQKQFVNDLQKVAQSVQDLTTVVKYAAQQIDERSKQHQQRVEEKLASPSMPWLPKATRPSPPAAGAWRSMSAAWPPASSR